MGRPDNNDADSRRMGVCMTTTDDLVAPAAPAPAVKGDQSTNTLDDEQSLDYFNKYIAGDR